MVPPLPSIQDLLKKMAAEKNPAPTPAPSAHPTSLEEGNVGVTKSEPKPTPPTAAPAGAAAVSTSKPQPAAQPSISSLLKKQVAPSPTVPSTPPPSRPKVVVADESVTTKFEEKMTKIITQEKEVETQRRAGSLGIPSINLKGFPISPEALVLVPEEQARSLKVICFLFTGPELRLGAVDPQNPAVKELLFALGERHKTNPKLYLLSEESFNQGLKLYAALPKIVQIVKGVQISESELEKYSGQMTDFGSIATVMRRASATDILAVIIAASLKLNSSDIHIEAEEKGIVVRFRVDGVLQEVSVLEKEQWKRLISRIKLIAGLKLNITDQAQDGRFSIFQKDTQIDVRLSTIPTAFGESVVMRLLNPETIGLEFDNLGLRPASSKRLSQIIERPHGMIITTGPTGSGKTTTQYAILNKLNTKNVKIITLEDPIEYKVKGLNQSQIDYSKDYTFAKGLRSLLRQDPDIVMVGEIRDLETAEIAIQAALTGHLLLSTIHTNDAAGAIPRFLSMGVKPHLLAPAINAIISQRLVRKLCECKQPITLEPDLLVQVKAQLENIPEASGEAKVDVTKVEFFGPAGCEKCNHSGYKGRIGAYEILIKDQVVEGAILKGNVSEYDMRDIAKQQGMLTIAQDGLLKATEGITSVQEVKRVVGF